MSQEPQSIGCQVRKLIAKRLGKTLEEVTEQTTLYTLGVDDLTKIEIGLDIELDFDGEASDAEHEACRSVGDFIAMAKRLSGEIVA